MDYTLFLQLATGLTEFSSSLPPDQPLVTVTERDYAQALGQTVKAMMPDPATPEARRLAQEKCLMAPNLQFVAGDGISAAAVEANVREMFPSLQQGAHTAYKPKAGDSDAGRDVVCNIFSNGGGNPLEAAALGLQIVQKMRQYRPAA